MKPNLIARTRAKRGFAMPMAILVMVVLTAGVAAGFAATSSESITNSAHRGDTRAYNIAVAGLEQFLARRSETGFCSNCLADPASPTADSEWTRVSVPGGYADIKSVLVRKHINDTMPALYFIRSAGTDSSVKLTGASRSQNGTRIVGIYATWNTATVNVQGAWFAVSGLDKQGTAGRIDGTDECTAANGGGKPTLAGAVVPKGDFSGQTAAFIGTPPLDTTRTFAQLAADAKLDWAGILSGSIAADFDVTTTAQFPPASWFTSNPDSWPVIRVRRSMTLPVPGRGMIIADSNFTISGSNMWDGIVLIGGALTSNGNNTTSGATMSGLNKLLAGNAPGSQDKEDNSTANGQKTYVYNSCNVSKASTGLRSYKAIMNSYIDQIPVW